MEAYNENIEKVFKALGDGKRLEIIDILSKGEKCACELLEHFNFTQPTLSHHMKVLIECGLVIVRKSGTWNYYSLDKTKGNKLAIYLLQLITE
ncbi:MAG: ArsR/SmtB family transcription factor [Sarcina sp.]